MNNKKICKIRILDEVNCMVMGLDLNHVEYFNDEYALHAKGYFFSPLYKTGQWDGKINFFSKKGKTFYHLLDELIPRIIALNYSIKVEDLRRAANVTPKSIDENFFEGVVHSTTGDPWKVRDYQIDMVNALLEAGSGIGLAGTGAGKTSMTAALALSYEYAANLRSIIIVPDKSLTDQTFREYQNFGLDVGQYGAGVKDGDHQHIVSTWQTLQNHPTFIQNFQVIVVDEAHGLRGKVLQGLLNKYGKDIPYRFGVTGTLPKEPADAMSIKMSVGPIRYEIPAHELQAMNQLADLDIDIIQHEIDFEEQYAIYLDENKNSFLKPDTYKQFRDSYFPDYTSEKKFLQSDKRRREWIGNYIKVQHDLGMGNVLCLVNGVNVGKQLAKEIPGAIFLSGKDKLKVRREAYELFKERNDVTVIATIHIAGTGLDIPRIFQLIGIDLGKSFSRVIQAIGRGLRKAEDKNRVRFSDITSDLKYSRKHLAERKKYYKEAKYKFKLIKVKLKDEEDLFS